MFFTNKKSLLESLSLLQRFHCSYDMFRMKHDSQPSIYCDCKYGFDGEDANGEQNGCPELRSICDILSVMTDDEYQMFVKRAKGIL